MTETEKKMKKLLRATAAYLSCYQPYDDDDQSKWDDWDNLNSRINRLLDKLNEKKRSDK